ncbi:MAG: phosphate butyryltransferase [Bacillales bacterium]|jgi:phosphate butyryltransferase|nr:phosphate butyryltransferase [Bacillales bacterium]
MTKLTQLIDAAAKKQKKYTVSVAAADDYIILDTVIKANEMDLCSFLLYGNEEYIRNYFDNANFIINDNVKIRNATNNDRAIDLAVQSIVKREADLLMKGNVDTAAILKIALNKEYGLNTGSLLSHVALFDVPSLGKSILLTDAALNITPSLKDKIEIINNSVAVAHKIGIKEPKVALLSAIEKVNPAIEATIDAAVLTQMNRRGQIVGCIVDGPLALDNAVSSSSVEQKHIESPVAGDADILIVPNIEVGNALYKSLVYFAKASLGSVVVGAKIPIILTSRADSSENKLNSIALALNVV